MWKIRVNDVKEAKVLKEDIFHERKKTSFSGMGDEHKLYRQIYECAKY